MKLLVDKYTNTVIDIVENATMVSNGIDVGKCIYGDYKNINIINIQNIPKEVVPQKYKYINDEFSLNENYHEPFDSEQKIKEQTEKINELESLMIDLSQVVLEV